MTTTEIVQTTQPAPAENLPAIARPRLPFHPLVEERFGIDRASWKALVEAIFPNATTVESVILALSYCRARKLDPFKRNVHIVPIWDKNRKMMVDTIWPGIGELRTTAFRTGEYAGRDDSLFGPDISTTVGKGVVTFPEWAQVTVHRMVKGVRVAFAGPRVYWIETYATRSRDDDSPNEMWNNRPRGQLDKCAEAAALRAAFPEEIGSDYISDEANQTRVVATVPAIEAGDRLTRKLTSSNGHSEADDAAYAEVAEEAIATDEPAPGEIELPPLGKLNALGDKLWEEIKQEAVNELGIEGDAVTALALQFLTRVGMEHSDLVDGKNRELVKVKLTKWDWNAME